MSESTPTSTRSRTANQPSPGGNAVYALGFIGSLVYFWKQAGSFRGYALAIFKAMVWPAFLVYKAFHRLGG